MHYILTIAIIMRIRITTITRIIVTTIVMIIIKRIIRRRIKLVSTVTAPVPGMLHCGPGSSPNCAARWSAVKSWGHLICDPR